MMHAQDYDAMRFWKFGEFSLSLPVGFRDQEIPLLICPLEIFKIMHKIGISGFFFLLFNLLHLN